MNAIPPELAAHLAGDITTLCHCWRLVRRDGAVLGFTDHDRAIVLGDIVFEPETGLSASEARRSLGLAPDAMDVAGALTSDRIAAADIEAGHFDGATVETLLVNWREPEQNMAIGRAVIGRISRADGAFTAELESMLQSLDRPNGRFFRRSCDAELGDGRCGVDLGLPGLAAAGTVGAVIASNIVRAEGLSGFAEGWFSHGIMTPEKAGQEPMRISSHRLEANAVLLVLDIDAPAPLEPGDRFGIVAGCDKRFSTCRGKFANSLNFRGFPHLPGNDAAYAYASEGATFDGGALVP